MTFLVSFQTRKGGGSVNDRPNLPAKLVVAAIHENLGQRVGELLTAHDLPQELPGRVLADAPQVHDRVGVLRQQLHAGAGAGREK